MKEMAQGHMKRGCSHDEAAGMVQDQSYVLNCQCVKCKWCSKSSTVACIALSGNVGIANFPDLTTTTLLASCEFHYVMWFIAPDDPLWICS